MPTERIPASVYDRYGVPSGVNENPAPRRKPDVTPPRFKVTGEWKVNMRQFDQFYRIQEEGEAAQEQEELRTGVRPRRPRRPRDKPDPRDIGKLWANR